MKSWFNSPVYKYLQVKELSNSKISFWSNGEHRYCNTSTAPWHFLIKQINKVIWFVVYKGKGSQRKNCGFFFFFHKQFYPHHSIWKYNESWLSSWQFNNEFPIWPSFRTKVPCLAIFTVLVRETAVKEGSNKDDISLSCSFLDTW